MAAVVAVVAWWASTAVILYRSGLGIGSYRRTFFGATLVLLSGIAALVVSMDDRSVFGAYLGFFGALAVFAWHEVSYLFGFITGSSSSPCPPDVRGWRRFVLGVKTSIYHELAVLATVVLLALASSGAANSVGLWTLVVLWLMRWSAKLNIFLGVPNLHIEFWPEHLEYLKSYVRVRPMNSFFPVSFVGAVAGIGVLTFYALASAPGSFDRSGAVLLTTLLLLAVLEHLLLVLRVADERIWLPALRSRQMAATGASNGKYHRESI